MKEGVLEGVSRQAEDTVEDGINGVLRGIGVSPGVAYCGKELLKGASSLDDAGSMFTTFNRPVFCFASSCLLQFSVTKRHSVSMTTVM